MPKYGLFFAKHIPRIWMNTKVCKGWQRRLNTKCVLAERPYFCLRLFAQ